MAPSPFSAEAFASSCGGAGGRLRRRCEGLGGDEDSAANLLELADEGLVVRADLLRQLHAGEHCREVDVLLRRDSDSRPG